MLGGGYLESDGAASNFLCFSPHNLISDYVYLSFVSIFIFLRELQDMMSTLEGEGGSWKSGCSKGGCMNLIV